MSRAVIAAIHADAIAHNFELAKRMAAGSKVMAVVKADGYGHGLERVVRRLGSADAFGVASIADGQRIRAMGLGNRIVVLSGIDHPSDLAEMKGLDLEPVIHHAGQIGMLEAASARGRPARAWMKVDTGMHRLGFAIEHAAAAYERLRTVLGSDAQIVVMTHFANSDVFSDPFTERQIKRFDGFCANISSEKSLCNSAGVLGFPQAKCDWVRIGGLLYGIALTEGKTGSDFGFQPAMTLSTKLIAINRVGKGEAIGYGHAWACPENMDVGVAAIGYGDGYPRHILAGTKVLIRGKPVAVIGRVSMDLISLDLRDCPDAAIGDPVILWGRGLPVEEVARAAGTIGYELVCGVTRRVDFVEDGLNARSGGL